MINRQGCTKGTYSYSLLTPPPPPPQTNYIMIHIKNKLTTTTDKNIYKKKLIENDKAHRNAGQVETIEESPTMLLVSHEQNFSIFLLIL